MIDACLHSNNILYVENNTTNNVCGLPSGRILTPRFGNYFDLNLIAHK